MSTPERPSSGPDRIEDGTWLEAKDILPANTPAPVAGSEAPRRSAGKRPRPWSLIVGLPLLVLTCLAAGAAIGVRASSALTGGTSFGSTGTGNVAGGSNINGDPLLSARVESMPQLPVAPVKYLEAQAKADGQTMWDLLSAGEQQQLSQNGGSAEALTQALQQGPRPNVKQITFAGGSTLNDGREAAIFVVTADFGGALRQVPYFFTVNTDGKIDEVH